MKRQRAIIGLGGMLLQSGRTALRAARALLLTPRTLLLATRALLLAACAVGLAACAATPQQQASARGTVTGRLLLEGGPMRPGGQQPGERPITGSVLFTTGHRRSAEVRAGRSGTFSVRLPAGRYNVSARSPDIIGVSNAVLGAGSQVVSGTKSEAPCSLPMTVTVAAGHTTKITITCIVP